MSAERHERLLQLFLQVCDLTPEQRAVRLEELCANDTGLRADVEKLLEQDAAPARVLDEDRVGARAREVAAEMLDGHPGTARDDRPAPGPTCPERIGRYRIVRRIGAGGMGVVYEAEQDDPRRRVALKVVRPGAASRTLLSRFRHEAHVLGQLRHPGIAQIYQAGTADDGEGGQPFFAMELVEGPSLLEYARSRELRTRDRLRLVARICEALHHAHQKGVIHRDLKPANILVEDRDDQSSEGSTATDTTDDGLGAGPKILDFGVARATDADIQTVTLQTDVGQLIGTLPYMSPEQASGDSSELDIRSDVYSLGVIMFELLSGRLPYHVRGKMIPEVARIIRDDDPSRLSSIDRVFRGDVDTIVAKTLEKDPARRYQSAAELAADIRRYLTDQPIVARPASTLYQLRKFAVRNQALAAAIVIAFVAMLVATTLSVWQMRVAQTARDLADERAYALRESAWSSYRAAVSSAAKAMALGDPRAAADILDVATPEQRRGWEYDHIAARIDESVARLDAGATVVAAAFAEDGTSLVTVTADAIQHWDHRGVGAAEEVRLDATITGPAALTRDGVWLAAVIGEDDNMAAVWNAATGEPLATLTRTEVEAVEVAASVGPGAIAIAPGAEWVAIAWKHVVLWSPTDAVALRRMWGARTYSLAFSADGRRLAVGMNPPDAGDAIYRVYDTDSLQAVVHGKVLFDDVVLATDLAATGQTLVMSSLDRQIRMIEPDAGGQAVETFGGHDDIVRCVTLSPDGRELATGSDDRTVRLWNVSSREETRLLASLDGPVQHLAYDVPGTQLLAVSGRVVRVYDLEPPDDLNVLRGHDLYVYGVAFTHDGARIASGAWDGDLHLWDTVTRECIVVPTGTPRVLSLAVGPELIATGHDTATQVILWDAETGERSRELRIGGGRVNALDFSDDGTRLAGRNSKWAFVVDPRTGEHLMTVEEPPARHRMASEQRGAVSISPDGARVASGILGGFAVWSVPEGETLARLEEGMHVQRLAFSPDGRLLAIGTLGGRAIIWDLEAAEIRHELTGHSTAVYALAFSPDGTRLATGSDDRLIILWSVERGARMLTLSGHDRYVFALDFSPDGSMLVSGSGDGTVRLWDTRPERERRRARASALRRYRGER